MKDSKIKIFYKPQMAFGDDDNGYSQSPKKPRLFLERLMKRKDFKERFEIVDFRPFDKIDFTIAHTAAYVFDFFEGKEPSCSSNSIDWSEELMETVRYTNASLYEAIKNSVLYPEQLSFSPTSGFHHATPSGGQGFCTFAGQVIASLKLYRDLNVVGCYFDLDGHFGNAIEDQRISFNRDEINKAIPRWANINPKGDDEQYMASFKIDLDRFTEKALSGKVDYVVWCHGADSHKSDNLGTQCNNRQWIECTKLFVTAIKEIEEMTGRCFPVSYSLFGGYRKDYEKVLDLHEKDTEVLLELCKLKD